MPDITAFPLAWPGDFPRAQHREKGAFKTTLPGAINNVQDSLRKFGQDSRKSLGAITISSNVTLGVSSPADPGVAVWFTWDGLEVCIPVDRYMTVAANLQAIHHVIEARRVELRHGTLALVRATMKGLLALPPPKPWRQVLKVGPQATLADVEAAYKNLARQYHPDRSGGSQTLMADLNAARAAALSELK